MSEGVTLLLLFGVLLIVVVGFVRICVGLRRGGGSLTTIMLGATDGFLTHEKSKAAETIVDENAAKRREEVPSTDPHTK